MNQQAISDLMFDTWTKDPNSGFTNEKVTEISESAKKKIRSTCDAVAKVVFENLGEGGGQKMAWAPVEKYFDHTNQFTLSKDPVEGSVFAAVNGQFLEEGEDFWVNGRGVKLANALAGSDRVAFRYMYVVQ